MNREISSMIVFMVLMSTSVFAQLEVGASYELRDEDPQSGFGVRIEKGFFDQAPIVDLSLRAHFSFFAENNNVSVNGLSYSEDLINYDFGVAVIAGISVGLIEPYVGVGLGSTTLEIKANDLDGINLPSGLQIDEKQNESNIFMNAIIGSKVSIIPLVKPFVEYRYSNASLSDPQISELTTGRIIFGVAISF